MPELEIEMFMGHNLASKNITGHYLHVRPEYLKSAVKAVDEYFAELAPLVNRPISRVELEEQPLPSEWLRAHCMPNLSGTIPLFWQSVLADRTPCNRYNVGCETGPTVSVLRRANAAHRLLLSACAGRSAIRGCTGAGGWLVPSRHRPRTAVRS